MKPYSNTLIAVICLALCLSWIPASAEVAVESDENEIVVTAQKKLKAAIATHISTVISDQSDGQYARFAKPLCPAVIGFGEKNAAFIEKRLRAIAKAADIQTGSSKCDPNIHVLVVEDGNEMLEFLRRKHRRAFGTLTPYQRDKIQNAQGPTYNWHIVETVSADDGGSRSVAGTGFAGGASYGLLSDAGANAGRTHVKSRIAVPVRQELNHGFLLIDKAAVQGLSVVQIADYAAMRTFLQTKEGSTGITAADSILSLFDTEESAADRVQSLAPWDLALLTALYKAPTNVPARLQRSSMFQNFEKALASGE